MFAQMKLTYKVFSISLFYSLIIIFVTAISYYGFNVMDDGAAELNNRSEQLKSVEDFEKSILNANLIAMDSMVDKEQGLSNDRIAAFTVLKEELDEDIKKLKAAVDTPEEIRIADEVANVTHKFMRSIEVDLFKAIKEKASDDEYEKLDDRIDSEGKAVQKNIDKIINSIEEELRVATLAIHDAKKMEYVIIISGLFSIVLGFILNFLLSRSIVRPIESTSHDIDDSSTQVNSASREVSEASQSLAEASSEQASSIEEISASLEELTRMVENNTSGAEKSAELSSLMQKSSENANLSMQELIKSMHQILESNQEIQKLTDVIGEIAAKTLVIDEIVFQTKLLSFNASVEAERAGEHGRGFAVVAQEVGNLAQMSGKAALEISAIVKESIKNAEHITTSNRQKVEVGNKLVSDVAKVLEEISTNSTVVSDSAKQIVSASRDQAQGISQINDAIIQLDKVTQQNASTAEETASSSEELSAQADKLIEYVKNLGNIIHGTK